MGSSIPCSFGSIRVIHVGNALSRTHYLSRSPRVSCHGHFALLDFISTWILVLSVWRYLGATGGGTTYHQACLHLLSRGRCCTWDKPARDRELTLWSRDHPLIFLGVNKDYKLSSCLTIGIAVGDHTAQSHTHPLPIHGTHLIRALIIVSILLAFGILPWMIPLMPVGMPPTRGRGEVNLIQTRNGAGAQPTSSLNFSNDIITTRRTSTHETILHSHQHHTASHELGTMRRRLQSQGGRWKGWLTLNLTISI